MEIFNSIYSATKTIAFLMITVTASASCSLKEDRDGCPCHLVIGLENAVGNGNTDIFIFQDGEGISSGSIAPSDYPEGYRSEVRRRAATISVLQGIKEGLLQNGNLVIRDGNDADRLFLHNETLQCNSETVRTTADLHKNWTTLEISLAVADNAGAADESAADYATGASEEIISIDVSGGICGISLIDGSPIKGDFRCRAILSDSGFGVYSVNLPRQRDTGDEILVSVKKEGKELFTCDISDAISNAGFDWSKPDLDDIRLRLDYASATFSIEIAGWDRGTESDKII